ncbi:MAG: hypothetical protein ACHQ49_16560 [Elusimicrobiota bacterium]
MKRLPLAVMLALGVFVVARADEGAYKNLVGMAKAAQTDRGPDPNDVPDRASTGTEALKDAIADVPSPGAAAAKASRAARDVVPLPADAGAVAAPAAARTPLWTRLYSTLLPAWRRAPEPAAEFAAAPSTAAARSTPAPLRALMPPPDSEAVTAGERRGLSELMSVSAPERGP